MKQQKCCLYNKKGWEKNPEYKALAKLILETLTKNLIDANLIGKKQKDNLLIKKKTVFGYYQNKQIHYCYFKPTQLISVSKIEKLKKFNENQKQLNVDDKGLSKLIGEFRFQVGLTKGDEFKMNNMQMLNEERQFCNENELVCEKKFIYLIDFWAPGQTNYLMKHYKMIQENEEQWKKVKHIAITEWQTKDETEQMRIVYDLDKSVHYRMSNKFFENSVDNKHIVIPFLPFVILVNRNKQIHYLGDPQKLDIKKEIELLKKHKMPKIIQNLFGQEEQKEEDQDLKSVFKDCKQQLRDVESGLQRCKQEINNEYQKNQNRFNLLNFPHLNILLYKSQEYGLDLIPTKQKSKYCFEFNVSEILKDWGIKRYNSIKEKNSKLDDPQSLSQFMNETQYLNIIRQRLDEYEEKLKYKISVVIKEDNLLQQQLFMKIICRDTNLDFQNFSRILDLEPEFNHQLSVNIPLPNSEDKCQICQNQINNSPYYWSYWSNVFYCCDCVQKDNEAEKSIGYTNLKISDTLIYVNAPITDKSILMYIKESRLGENLKIRQDEVGQQRHNMICNGCRGHNIGCRYVGLSCRPESQVDVHNLHK